MTNSFHKQKGAATLIITVIALAIITMIVLFGGRYGALNQKITSNSYRQNEAFEAAEAGLEFAIPYLTLNRNTITANKVSGFIQPYSDSNTTNVTLGNGTRYSISYSNPVANNYNLILITSTGTSRDGTGTRVVQQLVQYYTTLSNTPSSTIISQGAVSLSGNTDIRNTQTNQTIRSGAAISFDGSSQTTTSTGKSSSSSGVGSDITQNATDLSSTSPSDLFANYFGVNTTTFKNGVANYYSNSSATNYSSTLNGKVGTTIWIDQSSGDATLNGNTTIGSPSQPVILIVNGNLRLSGNITIYGLIYEMGGSTTTDVLGNINITGGLITSGNLNLSGSSTLTFDTAVFTNITNSMGYFAKVPGSWKDF